MVFLISSVVLLRHIERLVKARGEKTPDGNTPPRVWHAVLPPSVTRNKRTIIVGDVHGCRKELEQLLLKCGYKRGKDIVVSVGDLINKGPASEQVLRFVQEEGIYAVRGNHDDAALAAYHDWRAGNPHGLHVTKVAKLGWVVDGLAPELARLLDSLPFTLRLASYGVLVVHAGLVPGQLLQKQRITDMLKMRDVVAAAVLNSPAKATPQGGAPPGASSSTEEESTDAGGDAASSSDGSGGSSGSSTIENGGALSAPARTGSSSGGTLAATGRTGSGGGGNGGGNGGGGGNSGFDWQAALLAYAHLAQPSEASTVQRTASGTQGLDSVAGSSTPGGLGGGAATAEGEVQEEGEVGEAWQLCGAEHPSPSGKPWAAVWRGPEHVIFGHDAKRRLQLERYATGLDSGCVYGGQLTACILPPLDDRGAPVLEQARLPEGAREIQLSTGLTAHLVSVPATEIHSHKFDRTIAKASNSHTPQTQ